MKILIKAEVCLLLLLQFLLLFLNTLTQTWALFLFLELNQYALPGKHLSRLIYKSSLLFCTRKIHTLARYLKHYKLLLHSRWRVLRLPSWASISKLTKLISSPRIQRAFICRAIVKPFPAPILITFFSLSPSTSLGSFILQNLHVLVILPFQSPRYTPSHLRWEVLFEAAVDLYNLLVLDLSFYVVLFPPIGVVDWLVSSY